MLLKFATKAALEEQDKSMAFSRCVGLHLLRSRVLKLFSRESRLYIAPTLTPYRPFQMKIKLLRNNAEGVNFLFKSGHTVVVDPEVFFEDF
jgi:hypothetical protein